MERAPLPPHERAWRHPSELAAETAATLGAERASSSGRVLAFVSGATGLLFVGVIVLTMTPGSGGGPTAISSTTVLTNGIGGSPPVVLAASGPVALAADSSRVALQPRAVPVGEHGLAVSSNTSVREQLDRRPLAASGEIIVSLGTDGTDVTVPAVVVEIGADDGVTLLAILGPVRGDGLEIAARPPQEDDLVTVLSEPPISMEYGVLDDQPMDVDDVTPVIDADGALVGLCVHQLAGPGEDDDGVRFIGLDAVPVDATEVPD